MNIGANFLDSKIEAWFSQMDCCRLRKVLRSLEILSPVLTIIGVAGLIRNVVVLVEQLQKLLAAPLGSFEFWLQVIFLPLHVVITAWVIKLMVLTSQLNQVEAKVENELPFPLKAEYLLRVLLPREDREEVLGDLREEFQIMREEHGLRAARIWCWCEVIRSALPLIEGSVERLLKWGTFGFVAEWVRRLL